MCPPVVSSAQQSFRAGEQCLLSLEGLRTRILGNLILVGHFHAVHVVHAMRLISKWRSERLPSHVSGMATLALGNMGEAGGGHGCDIGPISMLLRCRSLG